MPPRNFNRAIAFAKKGDFDKEVADYTEAIRLKPDLADAYYGRGLALGKKGDVDRSIADFSDAIRLNPKYAPAYYDRGVAYGMKRGAEDSAIADYIKGDPA